MKEAALAASLAQRAVEETPDALVMCSPRDEVLLWSPGAAALFGYPPEQAQGRRWYDLVVPPERLHDEARLRERARQADAHERTVLLRHRDGHLLYADCAVRALREPGGAFGGWVISARDVTVATVEHEARQLEERYRDLLEWVPDAIVVANAIGRIVMFNSQSEAMFGCARGAMIGRPIETLLPARYGAAHVAHRLRYQGRPQVRRMGAGLELFGLRSDGSEFPVEISLSPLQVGERRYTMSAIRDISAQKRAEQELHDKNAALQMAHQAKDRFLATMSHELRTPLNAVLGFAGILLMKLPGPLNAEQERQIGLIKGSGEHLLSLINDLLDLAKINSGTLELAPELLDAGALLAEVHGALQPLAQRKQLALRLQLPPAPVMRLADRRALRQVLLNLASNAIKFTAAGHVNLALEEDGPALEFSVADTGVGIAADDLPRLFASFMQVGDPRRRPEGAGLGLHLSQRLAQLMGGRILVQSRLGEGSRFTLRLESG